MTDNKNMNMDTNMDIILDAHIDNIVRVKNELNPLFINNGWSTVKTTYSINSRNNEEAMNMNVKHEFRNYPVSSYHYTKPEHKTEFFEIKIHYNKYTVIVPLLNSDFEYVTDFKDLDEAMDYMYNHLHKSK